MTTNQEIIYFELNNWSPGEDYPAVEPFLSWMINDLNIQFRNDDWAKEQKLCILVSIIDMSNNFCISAPKEWVQTNCPSLLTEYTQFLRTPDEDGYIEGRFGDEFLEYSEENFGVTWKYDEDDEYYEEDEEE